MRRGADVGRPQSSGAKVLFDCQSPLRCRQRMDRHPRQRRVRAGQRPAHSARRRLAALRHRLVAAERRDRGDRGLGKIGGRERVMSGNPVITPPKILVIDSNVLFARRLTDALKQEGFEVVHSTQSAYAMTMLEWDAPLAILCATNMREMSAHEIPKILHADIKTAHIPIIAMGDGGDQALMEAFRAGCDDYVDRRAGPAQVASHVRAFLRSHTEGFQPTQMLNTAEAALSGSLSHLDLPGVVQMLSHSRQTGALHINAGDVDGIMFFNGGEESQPAPGGGGRGKG